MEKRNQKGFTIVEILVVISVIAVLTALLFPALTAARNRAKDTKTMNNLREIGMAMMAYQTDHKGKLPVAILAKAEPKDNGWVVVAASKALTEDTTNYYELADMNDDLLGGGGGGGGGSGGSGIIKVTEPIDDIDDGKSGSTGTTAPGSIIGSLADATDMTDWEAKFGNYFDDSYFDNIWVGQLIKGGYLSRDVLVDARYPELGWGMNDTGEGWSKVTNFPFAMVSRSPKPERTDLLSGDRALICGYETYILGVAKTADSTWVKEKFQDEHFRHDGKIFIVMTNGSVQGFTKKELYENAEGPAKLNLWR